MYWVFDTFFTPAWELDICGDHKRRGWWNGLYSSIGSRMVRGGQETWLVLTGTEGGGGGNGPLAPLDPQLYRGFSPFYPESTSASRADACREATGSCASCQEVGRCNTRGGSRGIYITLMSAKGNKAKPTLVLKPKGHVTRNPKQGYQWPQNRTFERVLQKNILKREKKLYRCLGGLIKEVGGREW